MDKRLKLVGGGAVLFFAVLLVAAPSLMQDKSQAGSGEGPSGEEAPRLVTRSQLWMESVNNLSGLGNESGLVVVGRATGIGAAEWNTSSGERPETVGPGSTVYHTVSFEVGEVLKGDAGSSVTVRVEGGTVGNVTLRVVSAPEFRVGERVVLFLEPVDSEYGEYTVTDMEHGKLPIEDGVIRRDVPEGYRERIKLSELEQLLK